MNRLLRLRWAVASAAAAVIASALVCLARPDYPGARVSDSVASNLRGGNCPNLAPLTCSGSGIHGNGTTCPTGTIIVGCNGWTCNPTGDGYCCGVSTCWMCYTGWLTCTN
jgi:hypothetical protein